MTRILVQWVLPALLALSTACGPAADPRSHQEPTGGYSFNPPAGWTMTTMPGLKYRVCCGEPVDGFTPNLNVVDEAFAGSLKDYVDGNLQALPKLLEGAEVTGRQDLASDDGVPMVRVDVKSRAAGVALAQTFYFIGPGERKYVITCTAPRKASERLEQGFSASARSIRLTDAPED